jgi:carboxymethylenebutenolidase
VVVCEANGISPQLLRVCQRLAAEGYATAAPDLFWRMGGSDPGADFARARDLREDDIDADLTAAVEALRAAGAAKVGITGFCMGGRLAYRAAATGLPVDAAASFYGSGIPQLVGPTATPVLAFFGEADPWVPITDADAVEAAHPGCVVRYAGAGHGFFRDGSEDFHAEASRDAWQRLLAFFDQHLR